MWPSKDTPSLLDPFSKLEEKLRKAVVRLVRKIGRALTVDEYNRLAESLGSPRRLKKRSE